jgi:glycosyltransferase involved in cell wall biosynthesis
MRIFNKLTFSRSTKIITLGGYMTDKILKNYRIKKSKVMEINNWAKGIIAQERAEGNQFTILYSGNMGFAHDFELFAIIIDRMKSENDIWYIFAGGGKRKRELVSLFRNLKEDRVIFKEYIERDSLSNVLAEGDVFLIAQSEATVGDLFPSKLYTYLAAGRPILYLGSKRSEIAEIILKNDIGFVCESETDIDGAILYLKMCKNYPAITDKVGKRARNLFENNYTVSISASKFNALLEEVCR